MGLAGEWSPGTPPERGVRGENGFFNVPALAFEDEPSAGHRRIEDSNAVLGVALTELVTHALDLSIDVVPELIARRRPGLMARV